MSEYQTEVQRLRAALVKARAVMEDALSVGEATYEDFDIKLNPWADLSMGVEEINHAISTTTEPKQDKTCVMCGTREGKYLSTANRWFCEPCTDALPPVNANAAKVERFECPCCGCEISINAPEGDGNDV